MSSIIHYRLRADSPWPLCGTKRGHGGDSTDLARATCALCIDMAARYNVVIAHLETSTIDSLFLELGQIAKARTWRELAYENEVDRLRGLLREACDIGFRYIDSWGATRPSEIEAANRLSAIAKAGGVDE